MPVDRKLGKKCRYTEKCARFQGVGIPENMTRTIWRNVFCYRGKKGWTNCEQYKEYQEEQSSL